MTSQERKKVFLVAGGQSPQADLLSEKIKKLQERPSFRKASRPMMMTFLAIEEAISRVRATAAQFSLSDLKESAFIVGSSYGELENTVEFLKNWQRSRLARPMLFQNSLHNATLGFLSLECALPGPSFTVSEKFFTGERALELGQDLIQMGIVDSALIAAVDVLYPLLLPAIEPLLPPTFQWKDGAGSVLLTSESFVLKKKLKPVAELISVQTERTPTDGQPRSAKNYYDSDGLERLVQTLYEGNISSLIQIKPDHSFSQIEWKFL